MATKAGALGLGLGQGGEGGWICQGGKHSRCAVAGATGGAGTVRRASTAVVLVVGGVDEGGELVLGPQLGLSEARTLGLARG